MALLEGIIDFFANLFSWIANVIESTIDFLKVIPVISTFLHGLDSLIPAFASVFAISALACTFILFILNRRS